MTCCVLLHGFLGSPQEWRPVTETVSTRCEVVVPPLPVAENWSSGIRRVCEALPRSCVIAGYSLGARIALGIAIESPESVGGLCLVSGNPGLGDAQERQRRYDHDMQLARRLEEGPTDEFLGDWYGQSLFASVPREVRRKWISERRGVDRRYQADLLRCYTISRQPNFWPRLATVETPMLLVVGQFDAKYVTIARRVQFRRPTCQLTVVPGAGHAVHRENAQSVAQRLLEFIDRIAEGDNGK